MHIWNVIWDILGSNSSNWVKFMEMVDSVFECWNAFRSWIIWEVEEEIQTVMDGNVDNTDLWLWGRIIKCNACKREMQCNVGILGWKIKSMVPKNWCRKWLKPTIENVENDLELVILWKLVQMSFDTSKFFIFWQYYMYLKLAICLQKHFRFSFFNFRFACQGIYEWENNFYLISFDFCFLICFRFLKGASINHVTFWQKRHETVTRGGKGRRFFQTHKESFWHFWILSFGFSQWI